MKIYLLSAICLVALVSASPLPVTPGSATRISTILYESDGETDYIIAEGYDMRGIMYMYGAFDMTTFTTNDNKSLGFGDMEMMALRGNAKEKKLSFALDSYPHDPDNVKQDDFCKGNSDKELKNLMDGCQGQIVLRGLREQERKQLQELKEEQKKTNEPLFKLVHLGKQIKMKSAGYMLSLIINDKSLSRDGEKQELVVGAGLQNPDGSNGARYAFILTNDNLFDRSFVIENIPKDSDVDCYKTDPADLKPEECNGLLLRQPNKDDY